MRRNTITLAGSFWRPEGCGRVYPKSVIKDAVDNFNKRLETGGETVLGELEHPGDMGTRINLLNVSHKVKKLELKEDGYKYTIEAELLNTPNGRLLQTVVNGGASIKAGYRGVGDEKNFTIVTFDIVQVIENSEKESNLCKLEEKAYGTH